MFVTPHATITELIWLGMNYEDRLSPGYKHIIGYLFFILEKYRLPVPLGSNNARGQNRGRRNLFLGPMAVEKIS